jgi:hypothetical protein
MRPWTEELFLSHKLNGKFRKICGNFILIWFVWGLLVSLYSIKLFWKVNFWVRQGVLV